VRYKLILMVVAILILISQPAIAGNWEINIFGVNVTNMKDKSIPMIIVGAVVSHVVHELGHLAYAKMHGGGHYDWDRHVIIMEDYHARSLSEQQFFHRAGFLAQLLVGGVLTLVPETRHTSFTIGFNGYSTTNTLLYTTSGGTNKKFSDILQLRNGQMEGALYTAFAGLLLHQNLQ
jgi:hypothetical protein